MVLVGTPFVRLPSEEYVFVRVARLDHPPGKQDPKVPELLTPGVMFDPISAPHESAKCYD